MPAKQRMRRLEYRTVGFLRGRLVIPQVAECGKVGGFMGRQIDGIEPLLDKGKYVSSRSTENYRKGEYFYMLNEALPSIRTEGVAVIVEGYLDAPAMHLAGRTNTIAAGTKQLSRGQIPLLKRHNIDKVLVVMDSDEAGRKGALRSQALLAEYSIECEVFHFESEDPAEQLRRWLKTDRTTPPPIPF